MCLHLLSFLCSWKHAELQKFSAHGRLMLSIAIDWAKYQEGIAPVRRSSKAKCSVATALSSQRSCICFATFSVDWPVVLAFSNTVAATFESSRLSIFNLTCRAFVSFLPRASLPRGDQHRILAQKNFLGENGLRKRKSLLCFPLRTLLSYPSLCYPPYRFTFCVVI